MKTPNTNEKNHKKNASLQALTIPPISKKMNSCLHYLDDQLQQNKNQTVEIAEVIIDDIKTLSEDYYEAKKHNNLTQHVEKVRQAQFKWINSLQKIILQQSNQTLNQEVIKSLQKFADQLNRLQSPTLDLELPLPLETDLDDPAPKSKKAKQPH